MTTNVPLTCFPMSGSGKAGTFEIETATNAGDDHSRIPRLAASGARLIINHLRKMITDFAASQNKPGPDHALIEVFERERL